MTAVPARDEAAGTGVPELRRAPERCVHRRRHRRTTGWPPPPPPDDGLPPPPPMTYCRRCVGLASDACCCAWLAAACLGLGAGLRGRRFGLHPLPRLAGPALLLLADQLAELCLGVGLGLLQLLGLVLGRLLGVGDLFGLVGGRLTLLLERLLLLGQLGDRLLEVVGVGRAACSGRRGSARRAAAPR